MRALLATIALAIVVVICAVAVGAWLSGLQQPRPHLKTVSDPQLQALGVRLERSPPPSLICRLRELDSNSRLHLPAISCPLTRPEAEAAARKGSAYGGSVSQVVESVYATVVYESASGCISFGSSGPFGPPQPGCNASGPVGPKVQAGLSGPAWVVAYGLKCPGCVGAPTILAVVDPFTGVVEANLVVPRPGRTDLCSQAVRSLRSAACLPQRAD